jgi:ribosomal protein S18 acetylase RimI-like enzyme
VLTAADAGAVRKATAEDVPRLADSLARAFHDDPGWSHLLPDPSDRTGRLRLFYETELRAVTVPLGLVWTTDQVVGAAVWMPPGAWRVPAATTLREVPAMIRVFKGRLPLALRSRLLMESRHPRSPSHWYLAVMGVAPEWQGRGLGTALMRPALEALDAARIPAYLESSTPRSRSLYQRSGFAVTGEFDLPAAGPPLWQMWRDPGAPVPQSPVP